MAVPAGPQIKLSDVAAEFSDTAPHQMSEFYRGGAKVPNVPGNAAVATSGALGLQSFKGTANRITVPLTISSGTTNYDVYTQASASPLYTAGISNIELTINPGVTVSSTSTGTYALNVPNAFNPGDIVKITNLGTVQGRGGNGGTGGTPFSPGAGGGGGAGGSAVYVNFPTTIDNVGYLTAGGGGGGGGGGGFKYVPTNTPKGVVASARSYGGGGGGGGAGTPGGSGGGGGSGSSGQGGSGGSGQFSGGGGGGAGPDVSGAGGSGGGRGANGSNGGGGSGAPPALARGGGGGGTRGSYLVGNPLVTFETTGTREGSVS